ncbi:MAG: hypothetical protein KGL39_04885 [Patescibacteria group bacterium]|nr:hypothetical protein [Patescibacteria group bacterium]
MKPEIEYRPKPRNSEGMTQGKRSVSLPRLSTRASDAPEEKRLDERAPSTAKAECIAQSSQPPQSLPPMFFVGLAVTELVAASLHDADVKRREKEVRRVKQWRERQK